MQTYSLKRTDLAWQPFEFPGISVAALRSEPNGALSCMVRMTAGSIAPLHRLPGGEEILVLEGVLAIEEERLEAGDYRRCPPGASHASRALTDTVFFLSLPAGIEFLRA